VHFVDLYLSNIVYPTNISNSEYHVRSSSGVTKLFETELLLVNRLMRRVTSLIHTSAIKFCSSYLQLY